jgi:tetrapyrrole methylase family protein / MazG family protein
VFNIDDVIAGIVEKLIRRHPHVFGDVDVRDSAEVLRNWERIKRAENTEKDAEWRKSILDGIPAGLPALMRAMEVSKRVVKVGFEWERFEDVLAKLDEEVAELRAELQSPQPDAARVSDELGDLLFTVVQVARWHKIDAEEALRAMLARFGRRFRYIEERARESGKALVEMSLAEMDALWAAAKLSPPRS